MLRADHPLLCVRVSFVPAGGVSEVQVDVDPLSLRSLLLPYSTTVKFRLKHCVGEFLFHLCDEQGQPTHCAARHQPRSPVVAVQLLTTSSSALPCAAAEYIRLCGFGNAIGLLAEKGLPGQQGGHEVINKVAVVVPI